MGTPKFTDRLKNGANFLAHLFTGDKSSATRDASLFTKSCPKKVCETIIKHMEMGMSEEQAYEQMIKKALQDNDSD